MDSLLSLPSRQLSNNFTARLVGLLMFTLFASASQALTCPDLFGPNQMTGWGTSSEKIGTQVLPFYFLKKDHPDAKIKDGRVYIPAKKVDSTSSDDLFIGFSVPRNHAYLVFRGQRLDGGIAVTPLVERLNVKHNSDLLESGIFLRFKDIPAELKDTLEAYLNEKNKGFSATCVRGVCGALKNSAGLYPADQITNGLLPTHTLSRLIKKGLVDQEGHVYKPEVYLIGGNSLNRHLRTVYAADALQAPAGVIISTTTIATLYMMAMNLLGIDFDDEY